MITWSENLRCPDSMKDSIKSIRRRLKWRKAAAAATYCITLPTNPENLFDIYNMGELLFKYYRDSDTEIHIVGLASSRDEACELAGELVNEIYTTTGALDVRKYFNR